MWWWWWFFSCSYILNSQTDSWYYFSTLKTKVDIYEILKPVFPVLFKYIASSMYPLSSWFILTRDLSWFLFSCASSESPLSPTNQYRKKNSGPVKLGKKYQQVEHNRSEHSNTIPSSCIIRATVLYNVDAHISILTIMNMSSKKLSYIVELLKISTLLNTDNHFITTSSWESSAAVSIRGSHHAERYL